MKHAKTSIVKWAMLLISNRFFGNIGLKNAAERDLVHVNGSSVPAQNTNAHNSQSIHRLSFRIKFLSILVCIDKVTVWR